MFTNIVNYCNNILNEAGRPFRELGSAIEGGFNAIGRKVEDITSVLPADIRNVANDCYWSLPYTAALLTFIPPGLGVLAAGTAVVAIKVFEKQLPPQTAMRMYQGVRSFCAIGIGVDVARTVATGNPVLLFSIPFYILFGAMAHQNARDLAARQAPQA